MLGEKKNVSPGLRFAPNKMGPHLVGVSALLLLARILAGWQFDAVKGAMLIAIVERAIWLWKYKVGPYGYKLGFKPLRIAL